VIVSSLDKMIEIQVRTSLQHLWAELSEKLSDIVDPAIKYGAGNEAMRSLLADTSTMVVSIESLETTLAKAKTKISLEGNATDAFKQLVVETEEKKSALRQRAFMVLRSGIEMVEGWLGETDDLSD